MTSTENTESLNRQIQDMILMKKLSPRKIRNLVNIKKMADRLAQKPFLADDEVDQLVEKFGVKPDVITWGDYFQTEIAFQHWEKPDHEFEKVVQTVSFDLIAATMIFSGKDNAFREQTRSEYHEALHHSSNAKKEESLHMGILLEYYEQLGLEMNNLTNDDFNYFEQFVDKQAAS